MSENIRQEYNKDLVNILQTFFDQKADEVYGNYYAGIVKNNNDPKKLGRCQIRVYGIYGKEIIDNDLPWALPDFNFVGSLKGSFIVPPNECIVNVRFDQGDVYRPIYTSKIIKKNSLPDDKNTDYPNMMVFFQTDEGDKFILNRKTGQTIYEQRAGIKITMESNGSFKLEHQTGPIFEIDVSGNVKLFSGEKNPLSTITIEPGAAGRINIGKNAIRPCPDALTCYITGAPLATNTLIPGMKINIP